MQRPLTRSWTTISGPSHNELFVLKFSSTSLVGGGNKQGLY